MGALIIAASGFPGVTRADAPSSVVLHERDGLSLRGHLQAGANLVAEENLFWNLSDTFAPNSGFEPDTLWLETYAKPGLSFEQVLGKQGVLYGKASVVLSDTRGTDAYDTGDTGRLTLEDAYAGVRVETAAGLVVDLSAGRRPLKLGTGMLVENGASSGFERGALKLGPRKAWERAAIARLSFEGVTSTTFYLDPNETRANDARNALVGTDLRFDAESGGYLGATVLEVTESDAPYPRAAPGGVGAPTVVANAREGLRAANVYGRTRPFSGALAGLFFTADAAYEWNDRVDLSAWAARGQVGYAFENRRWRPSLMYAYQTFSGDDPGTGRLERFDPLFFEGSPSSWATGSKSSFTFINSNVQAHQLTMSVHPTAQDRLTLRYAHIRVNEERSPVQFGQATRFDLGTGQGVVTGVTDPHLADDVFLEYFRIVNPNTFVTAGVSASFPGAGLNAAARGAGARSDLPTWLGGFINLVVNY